MAACTAASGVWISYRCTYTADDVATVENEEACNAEIIPVPPAALVGAGTVDPEYTGQWLIEEGCTAIDPDVADDVARCEGVDISGADVAGDRQACTNAGGGGICLYTAAVAGHCSQDKTNVVRFPQEDGTLIAMQQQLQCQMAVTVQQQHSGHQQWQQLGQQHSTLQQQWHHVQQQQQCIQQLQSEVQRIQAQQSQQLDLFVHPQNQAAHCKLCGLGQRVTDLEQRQQAQISQLEAAMAQQTQNQIQCALHQQQQARISDLEAERAATA